MFWAFQTNFPGSGGLTSSHVLGRTFPRSAGAVTGRSKTTWISHSGVIDGVETINRGAAVELSARAKDATRAVWSVFMINQACAL